MKEITIDGVEYVLMPKKKEGKKTVHSYKVVESECEKVRLEVMLDDYGVPLNSIPFDVYINGEIIDNDEYCHSLYKYIITGLWIYNMGDKDYADGLTKEEKEAFVAVYEKSKELGWI